MEFYLTLVKYEKRDARDKRLEIPYSVEFSILLEYFRESSARMLSNYFGRPEFDAKLTRVVSHSSYSRLGTVFCSRLVAGQEARPSSQSKLE
jgi:hypothetical protein